MHLAPHAEKQHRKRLTGSVPSNFCVTLLQIDKTGLLETISSMTSRPSQSMSSTTVTVQTEAALDPYRFNMFMADLLAEHGKQITHMAGTLNVQVGLHAHTDQTSRLPVYTDPSMNLIPMA